MLRSPTRPRDISPITTIGKQSSLDPSRYVHSAAAHGPQSKHACAWPSAQPSSTAEVLHAAANEKAGISQERVIRLQRGSRGSAQNYGFFFAVPRRGVTGTGDGKEEEGGRKGEAPRWWLAGANKGNMWRREGRHLTLVDLFAWLFCGSG
ncbi:hypothetical protein T440DRAFT_507617 [Plenodomus tracheiphilus IPT5]|uniref:Uncharacterized protein n=1 Tax=Plenodomus tracheiphilus IPT5 TaxID=1408161 RepID=A0A6A7B6F4_9PLEO|nr:hypothetical protein T440DRAFT_507617 [Plenodomus tracheiphilus IPT5]